MARTAALMATALVAIGLGTGAYFAFSASTQDCAKSTIAGGKASIGGPFELVSQTGETLTEKQVFQGPSLVYFGFTYCPDLCPLDVTRNIEAIDILKEKGQDVTPVFITIDPNRDTPDVLLDYAENLYPEMIALTGSQEQIDRAVKAYRVYAKKSGEEDDYLMDHSTFSYLVQPDGFQEFFRRDLTAEQLADRVACHL